MDFVCACKIDTNPMCCMVCVGSGVEFQGCYPANRMYKLPADSSAAYAASSSLSPMDPALCGVQCADGETQIRFSPTSVVRSTQEFVLLSNGFTVELMLNSENEDSQLAPQLIMVYGASEASSIRITLGRTLTVWKCSSSLAIPFGMPLKEWTHVALSIDADNQVRGYINGQMAVAGTLSSSGCEIPDSAFIQFGRGVFVILSSARRREYEEVFVRMLTVVLDFQTDSMGALLANSTSHFVGSMDEV